MAVPGTPDYKGTPETQQEFFKQYYLPKTEGDWQITKLPHPTIPGDEITVERNKRTGQTRLPQYPGAAGQRQRQRIHSRPGSVSRFMAAAAAIARRQRHRPRHPAPFLHRPASGAGRLSMGRC